jgi:hypothetical protein
MPTARPTHRPATLRVVSKWGSIENTEEPMLVAVPMTPFSVVVKW